MLPKPMITASRPAAEAIDDLAIDDVGFVATAEFPRYSMLVEVVRSRAGSSGVCVDELSRFESWGLLARNGEPYIVRVRVKDFADCEVARAHLLWWGLGSAMKGDSIFVRPANRRKGIASAMYRLAEQVIGQNVMPSVFQTGEGRALWVGLMAAKSAAVAA